MKQSFLDLAEIVDAWRLFPRLLIVWFMMEVSRQCTWYMMLETREVGDHLVLVAVIGLGTAAFKFYVDSGRKWS